MARVLLVEDDEAIREMMTLALEEANHAVTAVGDGQVALATLPTTQPDVLVLDFLLPHVSGRQVLEHLAQDPAAAALPVILCTALSAREVEEQKLPHTVTPLYKPFDLETLLELVRDLGEESNPDGAGSSAAQA